MATPTANFTQTPHPAQVQMTAANTNRDGTGTTYTVVTAATAGTKVRRVVFKAAATTAAGMLRLYLSDGTHTYLFDEIKTVGATPSGTVAAERFEVAYQDFDLKSGWSLLASTHNAETWNAQAFGGDYA